MHCCHSEKLPCTVLASALPDDALGHHHPTEEAQRAKGTTTLHSTSRGEEEEGRRRRREETTRRAGGTGEVSSLIAFIIISTFMFLRFVSKFLIFLWCLFIYLFLSERDSVWRWSS